MSGRSTAEIVADLREACCSGGFMDLYNFAMEAADRLAELEQNCRLLDALHTAAIGEMIEQDALRPPCPTCGGTHRIKDAWADEFDCPDCVDGKMSFADMAATWQAIHDEDDTTRHMHDAFSLLEQLRAVRAEVTP